MATAKSLQKPQIIAVTSSIIRIAHPDISGYKRTYLTSEIAAGGTAMSVKDNNGFEDNDWFIIGDIGRSETEECDINDAAITRGQSLTITNTLKFAHTYNVPVTRILERKVKIYGAATDGGSLTEIKELGIEWEKPFTEYNLITTDTAYAYYVVKFYDGVTLSAASDYVASTGLAANSVEAMIQTALDLTNSNIDGETLKRERLIKWANEAQDEVMQFVFQDARTGRDVQLNWDFEVAEDKTTLALTQNENKYSLTSLKLKYPDSERAIISVKLGDSKALQKITPDEYDDEFYGKPRTEVATQAEIGDTSLVVDLNSVFADAGTLYLGSDTITYTGKSGTNTFTGIPASGTGSITEQHLVDAAVWQNISPGFPEKYMVLLDAIHFNRPIETNYVGYPIDIRYFKKLDPLTEASDVTEISFYNVIALFVASRIMTRKEDHEKAATFMSSFNNQVLKNARKNVVPMLDVEEYYSFDEGYQDDSQERNQTWSNS